MPQTSKKRDTADRRKTGFISEFTKLKSEQDFLEKTQSLLVGNFKTLDLQFVKEIKNMHTEMERKRLHERNEPHHQSEAITNSLEEFRNNVEDRTRILQNDMDYYRNTTLDLEAKLSAFTSSNTEKLEMLTDEESVLTCDLGSLEIQMDDWRKPVNLKRFSKFVKAPTKSYIMSSNAEYEDVQTFMTFISETGGHTGGWEPEDHSLFLQARRKYRKPEMMQEVLTSILSHLPEEDLVAHNEWFERYEHLKQNHRLCIDQWRAEKTAAALQRTTLQTGETTGPSWGHPEAPEETKLRIRQWRESLEEKKSLEKQKEEEGKQKELKDQERRARLQEQQRAVVENYQEDKMAELKQHLALQRVIKLKEIQERQQRANCMIKEFRAQDEVFVARRVEDCQQRRLSESERTRHLEQLAERSRVVAERDPARLLRPTRNWEHRCKMRSSSEPGRREWAAPLNLRNMPHLAVPAWRRGLPQ